MNCPACAGALELSPAANHARCNRCDRLFTHPAMAEVAVPVGVDPLAHSESLGFPGPPAPALPPDPMTAMKNSFANKAANVGVRVKVGGVSVDMSRGGVGVDTSRLEKDLKNKAERTVSGWIWGCVGSVVIGGLILLGFLAIGGFVAWQVWFPGAGPTGATGDAGWDGKAPYTCPANGNVTISNVTASLPGETAITAGANCVLTLDNVDITAGTAISAGGNAVITVNGGHLSGSEHAVSALGNSTVTASGVKVEGDVQHLGGAKVSGF